MKSRRLGTNGPTLSAIAPGCMGMSEFYGRGDENESLDTIEHALELGRAPSDFAQDDYRGSNPRFQGENFRRNLVLPEKVR